MLFKVLKQANIVGLFFLCCVLIRQPTPDMSEKSDKQWPYSTIPVCHKTTF